MKKLMMKYVFLLLFLPCIFSSCRNERKEQYMQEVEKTLDREIKWINERIENKGQKIRITYEQYGRLERFKSLLDSSTRIVEYINSMKRVSIPEQNVFLNIDAKNQLLGKLIDADLLLGQIYDEMNGLEFVDLAVVVKMRNNLLKAGDSLNGEVFLVKRPEKIPKNKYNVYLNEVLVDAPGGKASVLITGDSTSKMHPGSYKWQGNIVVTHRGADSSFTFWENYQIKAPICEN